MSADFFTAQASFLPRANAAGPAANLVPWTPAASPVAAAAGPAAFGPPPADADGRRYPESTPSAASDAATPLTVTATPEVLRATAAADSLDSTVAAAAAAAVAAASAALDSGIGSDHEASSSVAPSNAPSSPASSVWSDGDRERPPPAGFVLAAATYVAGLALQGDAFARRPAGAVARRNSSSSDALSSSPAERLAEVLAALVEAGLLSAHTLVCCVSLVSRVAAAVPKAVSTLTVRRVAVACAVLAAKAECDETYAVAGWAATADVSAALVTATEAQVFKRLEYDVATPARHFYAALAHIFQHIPDGFTDDALL